MAAIRDRTKATVVDSDEPLSVAQQQLQQLLKKQLSTKKLSVQTALEQGREFTPAVVFKPLESEIEGLHSLQQYQTKKEEHGQMDHLRELGLTNEEIELLLSCEECLETTIFPSLPKKKKLKVEPQAQQERLEALKQKIIRREELLEEPLQYTGAHRMSRHAMEVEKSLFRDRGNPLTHLTVEDSRHHVVYPDSVIPSGASHPTDSSITSSAKCGEVCGEEDATTIIPLPSQVVERNRLSETEIRALPKFSNYSPGEPSKVLYLKNLHRLVTVEDLKAVFGVLAERGKEVPSVRLMTGRMRGQAFAEFKSMQYS